MTYSLASARKWCNDSEFALIEASFSGKEVAWTPAQLRAKIERTRKLHRKNLDQSRKIQRTNRAVTGTKVGKQVTAMAVADKRAKLFGEALARFTAKLDRLNAAKRIKALKTAVAEALRKKQVRPPVAGTRAAPKSGAARGKVGPARAVSGAVELKRVRTNAAVRARNARNQARRDARR
jgi:hypothetical protein